jgi:hypothetical protein
VLDLAVLEAAFHLDVGLVGELQLVVVRLALHVVGDNKIRGMVQRGMREFDANQVSLMRLMKVSTASLQD